MKKIKICLFQTLAVHMKKW